VSDRSVGAVRPARICAMTSESEPPGRHDDAESGEPSEPPPPPGIERGVRLYPYQWFALPLLIAIPALAILEVFGPTTRVTRAERDGIRLEAEHPATTRFGRPEMLRVVVRNESGARLDSSTLVLDSAYFAAFREISVAPAPATGLQVTLPPLAPGESHAIRVDARPHRYFRARGEIELLVAGAPPVGVAVSTFILP
jgi:hypothetical protein